MKEFYGARLKLYRWMNGLTVRDLAAKLECSHQLISQWEAGKKRPSKILFEGLVQITDMDREYYTTRTLTITMHGNSIAFITKKD